MDLEVRGVKVAIDGKEILHGISAAFSTGRRTAIIGPNGAGKSTLLKALAAINTDYTGEVLLAGQEIRTMGRKDIAKKIGILPQGAAAPPDTTVYQLVDYGRFPYRSLFSRDAKADREVVEWAMAAAHVEQLANRQVQTLSGGERQRVFLAMVLAQQPEILLLDEPTTYLDIAHQLEVMEIVERLNRDYHMTIIMVLHDINHALQYADEIIIIKDGTLKAQGLPAEVMTVDSLAATFGVKADIFVNSQGKKVLSPIELVK
ncbi:ABC transporter ATP-binding protein [Selenomonas ruminantium]|uniref:ABC transporter ATP-binding protein n=1 Tax=Selenomonas ruminantium TaxID=971 RepID=UPI0026ECAE3D|nr:ABC transporter ATP-binding protein [Selenomonas ruminantium]